MEQRGSAFCSVCGARLAASSVFCDRCGAKRNVAPAAAPTPAAAPDTNTLFDDAGIRYQDTGVLDPTEPTGGKGFKTEPVFVPAENAYTAPGQGKPVYTRQRQAEPVKPSQPIPVRVKEEGNSMLLPILSLGLVAFCVMLSLLYPSNLLNFRNLSDYFLRYLSTNLIPSTVAAAVVPALGFVACKLKKETLLRVGLIVAAASLGMQLIFMVINIIWSINGLDWKGLSQITRYVNGEDLLTRTVLLFRGMNVLDTLLRIVGSACYVAKNGLVLVACLLGVMKTEK